ncbi:hypothetical protein [Paraburkholderia sp. MM5482-R1]|uniref:hypothetical protein n=1 Tax=unclassified Paraburkholderia TaxID=2615204 RepID=UPI003D24D28A
MPIAPWRGERYLVSGSFDNDTIYGLQFVATAVRRLTPDQSSIYTLLGNHPFFAGIGPSIVGRIRASVGDSLVETLSSGSFLTLEKLGLTSTVMLRLISGWRRYESSVVAQRVLATLGLDMRLEHQVSRFWGLQAESNLLSDPYKLVPFCAWQDLDIAARRVSPILDTSPNRLLAAASSVLYGLHMSGRCASTNREFSRHLEARLRNPLLAEQALSLAKQHSVVALEPSEHHELVISSGLREIIDGMQERCGLHHTIDLDALSMDGLCDKPATPTVAELRVDVTCIDRFSGYYNALMAIVRDSSATHVVSSSVRRNHLHALGVSGHVIHLFELLSGRYVPHGSSHFVIHDSGELDLLTASFLLPLFPHGSKILLVNEPNRLPNHGLGSFVSLALSESPEKVLRRWRNRSDDSIRLTPAPRNDIEPLQSDLEKLRKSTILAPYPDLWVASGDNFANSFRSVLAWARMAREVGTTIIATVKKHTAAQLNREMHDEHCRLMRQQGQPDDSVGLMGNISAQLSEPVVWLGPVHRSGMFSGLLGIISAIYSPARCAPDHNGDMEYSAVQVSFPGLGEVQLTANDTQHLSLGYAVPLSLLGFLMCEFIVAFAESSPLCNRRWIYSAMSRSAGAVILVAPPDSFGRLSDTIGLNKVGAVL